jgi:hypothetical protein
MKGAEISGRSRNTWSEQEYREEVGIHGEAKIPRRSRNTCREHAYRE